MGRQSGLLDVLAVRGSRTPQTTPSTRDTGTRGLITWPVAAGPAGGGGARPRLPRDRRHVTTRLTRVGRRSSQGVTVLAADVLADATGPSSRSGPEVWPAWR
jgi:hypothetical protein